MEQHAFNCEMCGVWHSPDQRNYNRDGEETCDECLEQFIRDQGDEDEEE